jgi:uncharacterized protein (TIGR03546 family)
MALGACLGLTPLLNLHNLVMVAAIALLNVSVPGAVLGWLVTIPLGFLLDPVFDAVGRELLVDASGLTPLWTTIYNTPILSFANLNNSVVLGSLIGWALLALPLYAVARLGVARYRATIYPRIARWRVFQVIRASKLYNVYRLFQA